MKNLLTAILALLCFTSLAQVSLSLELVEQHTGVVGNEDLSGLSTYRLYLDFENEADIPRILFGKDTNPLEIRSSTTIWQSQFGGATSINMDEFFFSIAPSIQYDSFVTIGYETAQEVGMLFTVANPVSWEDPFEIGDDLVIDSNYGGGIFNLPVGQEDEIFNKEGHFLIAQITTDGTLWGQINVDYQPDFEISNEYQEPVTVIGLEFGDQNGLVLGCTDPVADNYNSTANVLDGCIYPMGDLTEDGVINIADVLDFLLNFGCATDCGAYDFNGDGVVNVFDLMQILGLL